jgi:hypothetical protein
MRARTQLLLVVITAVTGLAGRGQATNPILSHPDPFIRHDAVTLDGR